jgi:hypothetical protein
MGVVVRPMGHGPRPGIGPSDATSSGASTASACPSSESAARPIGSRPRSSLASSSRRAKGHTRRIHEASKWFRNPPVLRTHGHPFGKYAPFLSSWFARGCHRRSRAAGLANGRADAASRRGNHGVPAKGSPSNETFTMDHSPCVTGGTIELRRRQPSHRTFSRASRIEVDLTLTSPDRMDGTPPTPSRQVFARATKLGVTLSRGAKD